MDNNELLMIVLAFVLGCMCSQIMKSMCGGRLVEGSIDAPEPSDYYDTPNYIKDYRKCDSSNPGALCLSCPPKNYYLPGGCNKNSDDGQSFDVNNYENIYQSPWTWVKTIKGKKYGVFCDSVLNDASKELGDGNGTGLLCRY
tara:strand:+ start:1228 stop:1653 length:426 start_codon:yes stop_codon:yes gene_type:complete